MSNSPSNLKLALDAYDAHQRRQAALVEAQRIGTLIHIQEQQLLAAKHLAKQRKAQRRRSAAAAAAANVSAPANVVVLLPESAVDEDEEDSDELAGETDDHCALRCTTLTPTPTPAAAAEPSPMCPDLVARRAARSAAKRASLLVSSPTLESIPEPVSEEQDDRANAEPTSTSSSNSNSSSSACAEPHLELQSSSYQHARYASHKRRPLEPHAILAPRSQWKPDSLASSCDNVLCKQPFSFFGPNARHHCRRCGNIFCASCLSYSEVLYDMQSSKWLILPEALLTSVFQPEPLHGAGNCCEVSSEPDDSLAAASSSSSSDLSSSLESGSSRASNVSSKSRRSSSHCRVRPAVRPPITDPLHTIRREPSWIRGTDEFLPSPVPAEWRDHLLDSAAEHKVCGDCHDELWDRPTALERYYAYRDFRSEQGEIEWALKVLGLEKWDAVLRKHDLTFKPTPKQQRADKARRGSSSTTTTTNSRTSAVSGLSGTSDGCLDSYSSPLLRERDGLDYLDRPTYPHIYAWLTPPTCVRFTSDAFKPAPPPAPEPTPTPSPFGMHKSPAKFLPVEIPACYLATPKPPVPTSEDLEDMRQERYTLAVKEYIRMAYESGASCAHLDGGLQGVTAVEEPTWLDGFKADLEKKALDLAARWRGDPVGY